LHTSISAAKSFLVAARDSVRLFAFKTGIKIVSATGDIDIQAQLTSIGLLAKMRINMQADTITLSATKQVLVNGAGSYTRWTEGAIEEGTTGKRLMQSQPVTLTGADSMAVVVPEFAVVSDVPLSAKTTMDLFYHYPDLLGVSGASYKVVFGNGEVREGRLDANGKAHLQNVPVGKAQVYYGETSKTQTPELPVFGKQVSDLQVQQDLEKLGIQASSDADIDRALARLTERSNG
jgi:type VI secretion system secreted protein VgrG